MVEERHVYKTLINSYVRHWASRSSPIARGGRQRETTSTFCTSHVYNDASAMTMSSRTCLRAENSSCVCVLPIPVTIMSNGIPDRSWQPHGIVPECQLLRGSPWLA